MYFVTADEHYYHENIIKYTGRPFENVDEMTEIMVANHNSIVKSGDITIHAGDFAWTGDIRKAKELTARLNGSHIFLKGSHDRWMPKSFMQIWEKNIDDQHIVVCHYAMRTWARSHYNSWQLYGHSHGKLEPVGKQWDIGVDTNDFYPYSFDQIREIMKDRPDNPNFIPPDKRKRKWRIHTSQVDTNNVCSYSLSKICEIMRDRLDNFNYISPDERKR